MQDRGWEAEQTSSRDRIGRASETLCRYMAELDDRVRLLTETVSELESRLAATEGELERIRAEVAEPRREPDEHRSGGVQPARHAMASIGPRGPRR
jgi:uncharacterized small protein (DUF1192 family)